MHPDADRQDAVDVDAEMRGYVIRYSLVYFAQLFHSSLFSSSRYNTPTEHRISPRWPLAGYRGGTITPCRPILYLPVARLPVTYSDERFRVSMHA